MDQCTAQARQSRRNGDEVEGVAVALKHNGWGGLGFRGEGLGV